MKQLGFVILAAAATAIGGCSFAARSPEMYREDTQKALASKTPEIQACYDAALKGAPGVGGKVTVHFEVAQETGKIQNVVVDKAGTTAPESVSGCVERAIAGVAIAPPDQRLGQATFVYEFAQPAAPKS